MLKSQNKKIEFKKLEEASGILQGKWIIHYITDLLKIAFHSIID